ncbi:MAG TPA: hypothetical protein VD840_10595 [Sinorhizobium sp.]|nr:hypothetical protein [Sinorhizobium sp.]
MVEQAEKRTGKGGRRALWATVAVVAIAAAGMAGYKITLESSISEHIARRGGKVASVEADFLGRVHLREVTLPLGDGTELRIAAVDGRPKILFLNGTLELRGLEAEMAMGKVSIAEASVEDANFDRAALADISGKSDLPLSTRIERFAAKRVSAPEITLTRAFAGTEQKTTYKDVAWEDIADGRVARYSAGGATFEFTMDIPDAEGGTKKKRMAGSMGAMTIQDLDAAYVTRLYTEKAGPEDKAAKPIYGAFSAKDITFSDNEAGFVYDEVRGGGFSMRMPAEPLLETVKKLQSVTNPADLPPEERQAFAKRILSIVDMIGKGDVEMLGIKLDAPMKADGDEGKKMQFAIERIAAQVDGRKLDGALYGVSMGEGGDYIKFAEASVAGFSWGPTIEALTKLASLDEQQLETFPFTTLLPEFGTIRVAGVEVDLPNSKEDDSGSETEEADSQANAPATSAQQGEVASGPERIRFALKNYELALTKPYNGIPTDIRISYQDLSMPIPAEARDEAFVQMRKLGFDELVLSSNMEAAWDEANQNLVIKDISLSGKDLGSVALSGLLGGFTKDFFSGDNAMTQVALFGLTAREAKLAIEDEGLVAKGIKLYAQQNGMTEADVHSALAMLTTAFLQQFAADQPKLKAVAEVFSRFIAKPGTFTLTLKSKAERGLGAFDFVAASQNPVLLLDKIDLEATAQ